MALTLPDLIHRLGPAGRRRAASGDWYRGSVWVPAPGVAVWLYGGEVQVRREAAGETPDVVGTPTTIDELTELVQRASR